MLLLLRHNRGAALTAAGAVAALTLLLVVALARSSPFLKAGSDESALNQERQLELQEAIQVVKDDVTALKAQLRETDETIAKKKVMRRRQEDAVDIAKKEEQRVVDDGKMKMAALQRKDQRIAEATHKVPRDGSMMSSTIAAAKRIWEENRAAAHKEVQKERKKLEHATSEVEAAQQVKRDLARRVSESQALVKQLVTELEAISQPAGQRLKPGPPAGDLLEEAKAAGPGGTQAALQAGSEGAQADQPEVPEAKDEAADDQQLAAGGEEAEEEANDNAEGLAADRAAQANGTGLGEAGTQATEAKPPAIAEAAGEADFDDDSGSGGEGKRARELVGASPERDAPALGNRSLAASVQRAKGLARVDSSGSDVPGTLSSPNALDAGEAGAKSDAEDRLPPAGSPQHDDSIRCRTSYICEGPSACRQSADKDLACMRSAAERRRRIVESARWAWKGYRENAFGYDELHPVSRQPETWFNLGLTLVDSLDTLWLMNLTEEYAEARDWVVDSMRVDVDMDVNLFETTIRILGGLLTMHNLTGEEVYLERASELGHRLLPAFETSTGIPLSDVNLRQQTARGPKWGSDSSTSEVTTLYLEFSYLSRLTGDSIFEQKASRVLEVFDKTPGRVQGLCPIMINPNNGNFKGNTYTLGARGDSYYEYLLKCWIISGRRQERCLRMFKETMRGVREQLLDKTSEVDGLVYVAELKRGRVEPKMDHLVCFLPGLLVLAHWHVCDRLEALSTLSANAGGNLIDLALLSGSRDFEGRRTE